MFVTIENLMKIRTPTEITLLLSFHLVGNPSAQQHAQFTFRRDP
jgi:hypothetical protein